MSIAAICEDGPYKGKVIAQPESICVFNVLGPRGGLFKYERFIVSLVGGLSITWRLKE